MNLSSKTMEFLEFLQKRRRMELLVYCYETTEEQDGWIEWSGAKKDLNMVDGTFRKIMSELESIGFATRERYASGFKSRWRLTDAGCCIASLVAEKVADLNVLLSKAYIRPVEMVIPA